MIIAKDAPAHVQTTEDGRFEVRMYGYLVTTYDNKLDAIKRMRKESAEEKRYAYK